MKWLYVYRAVVVIALLALGGFQWHTCSTMRQLQEQQRNLLKPVINR